MEETKHCVYNLTVLYEMHGLENEVNFNVEKQFPLTASPTSKTAIKEEKLFCIPPPPTSTEMPRTFIANPGPTSHLSALGCLDARTMKPQSEGTAPSSTHDQREAQCHVRAPRMGTTTGTVMTMTARKATADQRLPR